MTWLHISEKDGHTTSTKYSLALVALSIYRLFYYHWFMRCMVLLQTPWFLLCGHGICLIAKFVEYFIIAELVLVMQIDGKKGVLGSGLR